MQNPISFVGRVGQVKELKEVGSSSVLEFSVASDSGWGERKTTNWYQCKVWGKAATSLQAHLEKGKQLFVVGDLVIREYDNKDGVKQKAIEVNNANVKFVGSKGESGAEPAAPVDTDEIPF